MKEDFLHFIWKYQKIQKNHLQTTTNQELTIFSTGLQNTFSGPDFLNSRIQIGDIEWAGQVEIHVKSSDWYLHRHHLDSRYDNVILHVVWEHDIDVCLSSGNVIPTLLLSDYTNSELLEKYHSQFRNKPLWIPCEESLPFVPQPVWTTWIEKLYIERLEDKMTLINNLLTELNNDWEAVLFVLLAKNFGLNVNGNSFFEIAKAIPFSVVKKNSDDVKKLEALFLGMSSLLSTSTNSTYQQELKNTFEYQQKKHQLIPPIGISVEFSRLRPSNFPTIRWTQLASLYSTNQKLFSSFFSKSELFDTDWMKKVDVSSFWKTHYIFSKESPNSSKKISQSFIDLLTINTLIPLKFAYEKKLGKDPSEFIFKWIENIKSEKNSVVDGFKKLKIPFLNALSSQSVIQLKKKYCDEKKCLSCSIGFHLLKQNEQ